MCSRFVSGWVLALFFLVSACNRDEEKVAPTEDNERITTVTLELVNKAQPTDVITATLDGLSASGTQTTPAAATLQLRPNSVYTLRVLLKDNTKNPPADISAAIRQEANEHLFVYRATAGLNLTVTPTDRDTNPSPGPYPIGLAAEAVTGGASSGKLNVVLRHQPDTKNGTPTPGTSDLDVNFDVVIKP